MVLKNEYPNKEEKQNKINKKKIYFGIVLGTLFLIIILSFMTPAIGIDIFNLNGNMQSSINSYSKEQERTTVVSVNASYKNWVITSTDKEEYIETEYENVNDTHTKFCMQFADKDAYTSAASLSSHDVSVVPIEKYDSKDTSFSLEKNTIDMTKATEEQKDRQCFYVDYEKFKPGMAFKIGWGTQAVNSTDEGTSNQDSWQDRVFYDPNNNRWHLIYIYGAYITSISSSDGVTWIDGELISDYLGYDYEDFDCVLDVDGSDTYLHCVFNERGADNMRYIRTTLTGTTPFILEGADEIPFDSGSMGGSNLDGVQFPSITIDSNRCVLIAFDLEDDSEVTADEHEIVLIREAGNGTVTCGDGDFDYNGDIDENYPIYSIQTDATGYNKRTAVGIESFGDKDVQLFWIDTDIAGDYGLETIFFDGSTNTTGTQRTLDADVEGSISYMSYDSVIIPSLEDTLTFTTDDGTNDLDAYITKSKGSAREIAQPNTGLDLYDAFSTWSAVVTAVVDTVSDNKNVWIFAVDDGDHNDLWYAMSSDSGANWINQTLWQDEAGINEVKYISAYFDEETCDIGVVWLGGSASPFTTHFDKINTGTCAGDPFVQFEADTPNNEIITIPPIIINITCGADCNATLNWNGTNETMIQYSGTNWYRIKTALEGNYTFKVYVNDTIGGNVTEDRWVDVDYQECGEYVNNTKPINAWASASHGSFPPPNSYNNDTSVGWASPNNTATYEWLIYDLGETKCVSNLSLFLSNGYSPENFTISLSNDNLSWYPVLENVQDDADGQWGYLNFSENQARYVKVEILDGQSYFLINEINFTTSTFVSNETNISGQWIIRSGERDAKGETYCRRNADPGLSVPEQIGNGHDTGCLWRDKSDGLGLPFLDNFTDDIYCSQWFQASFDETGNYADQEIERLYCHFWATASNNNTNELSYGWADNGQYGSEVWDDPYDSLNSTEGGQISQAAHYMLFIYDNASFNKQINETQELFNLTLFLRPSVNSRSPQLISFYNQKSFCIVNPGDNTTLATLDTDEDGLNDFEEMFTYYTDPYDNNTDDDLLLDYNETIAGTDGFNPYDDQYTTVYVVGEDGKGYNYQKGYIGTGEPEIFDFDNTLDREMNSTEYAKFSDRDLDYVIYGKGVNASHNWSMVQINYNFTIKENIEDIKAVNIYMDTGFGTSGTPDVSNFSLDVKRDDGFKSFSGIEMGYRKFWFEIELGSLQDFDNLLTGNNDTISLRAWHKINHSGETSISEIHKFVEVTVTTYEIPHIANITYPTSTLSVQNGYNIITNFTAYKGSYLTSGVSVVNISLVSGESETLCPLSGAEEYLENNIWQQNCTAPNLGGGTYDLKILINRTEFGDETSDTETGVITYDTCTYAGSGNWFIECSENCVSTSSVDLDGNLLILNGTGTFTSTDEIYNVLGIHKSKNCVWIRPYSAYVSIG